MLVIAVLVVLVVANVKIYQKRKAFLSQVSSLQRQIKNLQDSNANLKERISNVDNDTYVEKVAREELDLQKEGETVVSFVTQQKPIQEASNATPHGIQSWLGWLSGGWEWTLVQLFGSASKK